MAVHRKSDQRLKNSLSHKQQITFFDISKGCDCFKTTTFQFETLMTQSQIPHNCECPELTDK